tara:strand:+ start:1806 stop:2342 length:537 start_codon:yes stop_codon:yes gene_type:complete
MAYKCVYELKCTEYNSENDDNIEKEVRSYTEKVDATDFNMEELLLVFEDFLRASGYDWIEQNSLNIEGYELPTKELEDKDFEQFRQMLERLNQKKESSPQMDNMEIHERMMGIDRTAKIVSLHPNNEIDIPTDVVNTIEPEIDMTVEFDYDENIFSEDNDFSQFQYIIKENQEETKNE